MKPQISFTKITGISVGIIALIATVIAVAFNDFGQILYSILTSLIIILVASVCMFFAKRYINKYFLSAAKNISSADDTAMNDFEIAIMVANSTNEVIWYNEKFRSNVLKGVDVIGEDTSFIFSSATENKITQEGIARVEYKEGKFNVYSLKCSEKYEGQTMYFFYDDTSFTNLKIKFNNSRICVLFIHIDGLDVLMKNTPESKKNEMIGLIERQIEDIDKNSKGYIQKISTDKYLLLIEKQSFDEIIKDKFDVLNKVRNLNFGERGSATLSIGVGLNGKNLSECVEFADSALDMALGRGGDQAVIKNSDKLEFFGGVTESKPINSAVRIRLISQTLKKLIMSSNDVLIMGHSFADMDAFGSAYGLYCAIKQLGKPTHIVCNYHNSPASPLIRYTARIQPNDDFVITPNEAIPKVNPKTLLIIVDTHRVSSVESKHLYEKCKEVVVVDHHRRTVDFINNSILFYHDPSSSSASEMVTELLRYFGVDFYDRSQADALLAGIMLDTKNFVLKTSSKTFEALSFLREKGADPVLAKSFFSESIDSYSLKSDIVSSAKIYKNYAFAYCDDKNDYARISSAQAADELLGITGVDASFVATVQSDSLMNISARSYGKVNVQLIMEQLGGGGHQTMAAAQVAYESKEDFYKLIIESIAKANS